MNKVMSELYLGTQEPAVADLHEALLVLLQRGALLPGGEDAWREWFIELRPERSEQLYGDVTDQLVSRFQEAWRLDIPGQVDEPTAQTMNDLLRGYGLLDDLGTGWTQVVEVLNAQIDTLNTINAGTDRLNSIDEKIGVLGNLPPLSHNMRGEAVRNLHDQLVQIGIELPAEERDDLIFGVGTRDAVLQLQAKYDLARTGILDDATRNALEVAAGNVVQPRRVEGRIFMENGLPAANIKLHIVNKGFGEDATVLGEVVETDERGFYALPYTLDGAANIEVHAFDAAGAKVRLSTPKVNADRNEALNLVAPLAVKAQSSEFKLMVADLSSLIGGDITNLALAREDGAAQLVQGGDARQDLSMVHAATGWDARLVATAAKAAQGSAITGIAQDALYGALRAGLPDDPEALALVSEEAFATALERATEAGVIAGVDKAAAMKAFTEFALEKRRKLVAPGALSSAAEILDKAHLETVHKIAFESLVLMGEKDNGLWQAARDQGIPDAAIADLQLQGKLAYLTLNNAPLIEALQDEIQTQDNLTLLVEKNLYKPDRWVARLDKLASSAEGEVDLARLAALIPTAYTQADVLARRDAYAQDMARKVRQTFPSQVIQRRIENDELKLGAQHADMKAPVQTFLKNAAARGFQLGRAPVEQFIGQQDDTLYQGIAAEHRELAKAGVKLLTRAYQMTPNDEAMATLLDLGLASAYQVTAMPRASFIERYWERFGSRKVTEVVWEKSSQITSVTFGLYAMAKKVDSTPPVMAISGTPERHAEAKKELQSLLKEYPTMASLFGALDFCECEHCHSVLSPAAYLVDLLRFVDPPAQEWELTLADWIEERNGKAYDGPDYNYLKPYDALILRRPDLPHVPLTCENTNTALPYIDLVNEILEYYVWHTKLDEMAAQDTGEATSAELLAEPHNVSPEAYKKLQEAHYPLTLPFNLWLETARRFCAYFETPLWQVLDTFRPGEALYAPAVNPKAYYRAHILAEYLGLSPDEYAIFTSEDFAGWPKLYGYDGDTEAEALAKLRSAKTLSRRLGVSYKELAALVQTGFVNPDLVELVLLRKLGVSVSEVFRYKQDAGYEKLNDEEAVEFEKRLAQATQKYQQVDPEFDAKQWLNDAWATQQLDQVLLLRDPDAGCNFDETTIMHADGTDVDALDLVKLNLFVRLWKRLGWAMAEIDQALKVFLPEGITLSTTTLGTAFKTALVYLAHLKELEGLVSVGKQSRLKLLSFWTDLPTKGANTLYAQLFLTRNILKDDAVFDHPLGRYLTRPNVWLKDHLPAVQAALTLTADEIIQILQDGNAEGEADLNTAMLSRENVSLLYRYGLLAKGLKVSVGELIALKALTGLNPFHPLEQYALEDVENDHPLQQTIEFVRHAQRVSEGTLTVGDLNYLFRHCLDPAGKYPQDGASQMVWIRTLASELRTIANEYATPEDANVLSDEALKQKMGLVFAPDVIEKFMGFWLNQVVYSTTRENVTPDKRLPTIPYSLPGVSVSYDETRQRQQVTHTGVLSDTAKDALLEQIPQPAPEDQQAIEARRMFGELLDEIVKDSETLFSSFFHTYFDGLLKFTDFFGSDVTTSLPQKRLEILQIVLPFLREKLIRQTITQTLTAQTGADPALIETLSTHVDFLALPADANLPLLDWFAGLNQIGLTAETFTSTDLTEDSQTETVSDIAVKAESNINSARWRGYIEVPQSGPYRFYVRPGKKNATVTLRFEGRVEPLFNATTTEPDQEVSEFIELKAGVLYAFTLEARNLQNGALRMRVKGETTSKSAINQFVTLTPETVDGARRAYTLLNKAVQLVQALGISDREARHILAHPQYFKVNWQLLPAASGDSETTDINAASLFDGLYHLQTYAALKRDWADGGDDAIAIFEQACLQTPPDVPELCQQIADLTRRKPDVVEQVAAELALTKAAHFAQVTNVARLWQALQIVARFGIPMNSLKKWLTPRPDAGVAQDIRYTIKARYEPETWQRIAKSIFDPLRQLQRDALVAYIMHVNPELDSVEKLFEYFLIDPGMEPVVETSRIRLAISSMQTFIQRCFLNLEKRVHPSVLNAQHWAWMKRYRIWEANRKILLFPENWLEPEWRDDKTHLYQELESRLLQGDVTNQLAEDALYVYLKKLDQLARLEIVTMYAEEQPPGPPVMHVIGRTYSQPAQYFYRRYAHHMWTPWEPVSAEIDGQHIMALMWRERLYLFWLTFMEKTESAGMQQFSQQGTQYARLYTEYVVSALPSALESELGTLPVSKHVAATSNVSENEELGTLPVSKLIAAAANASESAARRKLAIQLNWSEYLQGEWTTRESSGFGYEVGLAVPFDPKKVFVTVAKETNAETGAEGAALVILNGLAGNTYVPYFRVTSKNSRPQIGSTPSVIASPYVKEPQKAYKYNAFEGHGTLSVTFVQSIVTTDGVQVVSPPAPQTILAQGNGFTLLPTSNPMRLPNAEFAPLISPLFYADAENRNTFFVEPSLTETTVDKWEGYIITQPSQKPKWEEYIEAGPPVYVTIPPKYLQEALKLHKTDLAPDPIDPRALHAIKPGVDVMTQPDVAVQFGDALIASTGRVQDLAGITRVVTRVGGNL